MCIPFFLLSTPVGNRPNNVLEIIFEIFVYATRARHFEHYKIELQTGCEPNSNYIVCEYKWKGRTDCYQYLYTRCVCPMISISLFYSFSCCFWCWYCILSMLSRTFFNSIFFFLPIAHSLFVPVLMLVKSRVKHLLLDRHNNFMIWINLPCHFIAMQSINVHTLTASMHKMKCTHSKRRREE